MAINKPMYIKNSFKALSRVIPSIGTYLTSVSIANPIVRKMNIQNKISFLI